MKIQGSIVDIISKTIFGEREGGSEYLTFKDSMQNVEDSVKFFTQDYASSAFTAYNQRSTSEIGTEICRAAIYGKIPGMDNFIDQMTRPEDPPQFTAVLSETPWSETQKQSRYNIFYHIYAGTDINRVRGPVRYSVFMKHPVGKVYYATEKCQRRSGRIEKGGFASFSLDCVADEGYEEICVT